MEKGQIFGVGNPLLDISVEAEDGLFTKYEVIPGSTSLAEEKHIPLYDELLARSDVEYIAGGSAQNTIRAAQWMSQFEGLTTYTGCVGKDIASDNLLATAKKAGVHVMYEFTDNNRTGTCAVLVQNKDRALIANISACNDFSVEHFLSESIQTALKSASMYFSAGFFLTTPNGLDVLTKIAEHANESNKLVVSNLGAPFLFDFFWDKVLKYIEYSDIIICNSHEAEALMTKNGWTDQRIAAEALAQFPKLNKSRQRTVIFTNGPDETLVYHEGKISTHKPITVPEDEIVDLNGAGDAFCGGLLAGLARGVSLEEAIQAGHYCAFHVIRRSGPTFPDFPDFKWSK